MMLATSTTAGSLLAQAVPALSLLPALLQSGRAAAPELRKGFASINSGRSNPYRCALGHAGCHNTIDTSPANFDGPPLLYRPAARATYKQPASGISAHPR